ncbi:unnamed protein product [Trichogramma brassicae]|uniref:Integrase catalytic domain-containing protein n=1 Tax=Trichogramma brassicae TaxID=86971 RepID=A0A6H5I360_9HYME|nr:unnamed protein product [Trichogramma brassicae]
MASNARPVKLSRQIISNSDNVAEQQQQQPYEKSALDMICDMMPFEMHVPGYRFLGPGTKLAKRLERGDVGINQLDEACREHDMANSDKNADRTKADRLLAERAFKRLLAGDTPPDERTFAMMTVCCMVSKITFEKFFSKIKKSIGRKNKKNKKKIQATVVAAATAGNKSKKKKKMSNFEKIYFSPAHPAVYAGAARLKQAVRKQHKNDEVSAWLEQQDAYNLHTPVIRKFPRRCYNVRNIDDVWEADLMDMRSLKTYNNDYAYLLVVIDALSKYAWIEPLKDKSAQTVSTAFERILRRSKGRVPVLVQTDKGKEFVSRETVARLGKKNIQHRVVRDPDIKAAIAERFIRTIKERIWRYFTHHRTRRFLDVLPKILEAYNNSVHSSIRMTPASVNLDNAALARKNLENRRKTSDLWRGKKN